MSKLKQTKKPTKFNTNNILGWSESDFNDVICEMVNIRKGHNLPVPPVLEKTYCSVSYEWLMRRYNIEPYKTKEQRIKELIKKACCSGDLTIEELKKSKDGFIEEKEQLARDVLKILEDN